MVTLILGSEILINNSTTYQISINFLELKQIINKNLWSLSN